MSLSSIEIPHSFYLFSSDFKSNVFTIVEHTPSGEKIPHIIEIIPGNYHSDELLPQIQATIDASVGPNNIQIDMNPVYGKTYIFKDPSSNIIFDLDFRIPDDPKRNIKMNMGWILGYRKPYYRYKDNFEDGCKYESDYIKNDSSGIHLGYEQRNSKFVKQNYNSIIVEPNINHPNGVPSYPIYPQGFVSEGFIDTGGARYLFLVVDDFNNNVSDQYISLVSKTTQLPCSNILARIIVPHSKHEIGFDDLSDFVLKKRDYFGGVTIEKLHFKLVDEYGRVVNLNNTEISLLLEFEVIYNL